MQIAGDNAACWARLFVGRQQFGRTKKVGALSRIKR
jgi:hypothetical protein